MLVTFILSKLQRIPKPGLQKTARTTQCLIPRPGLKVTAEESEISIFLVISKLIAKSTKTCKRLLILNALKRDLNCACTVLIAGSIYTIAPCEIKCIHNSSSTPRDKEMSKEHLSYSQRMSSINFKASFGILCTSLRMRSKSF